MVTMRAGRITLVAVMLLCLLPVSVAFSADYTPVSLTATVYVDGIVGVEYVVDVNPTQARVTVPLFGSTFSDLLIVNTEGLPLVSTQSGSSVSVDTLGSARMTATYTTQDLTSKAGTIWTLNVTSPTNLIINLPVGSTIVSLNQIPLDVRTVDGHPYIVLPAADNSVSYVLSAVGTKEHSQAIIQDAESAIAATKAKGISTTSADTLIAQAKAAFDSSEYLMAEQLATQAKGAALDAELQSQAAGFAIQRANEAIQTATNEGRASDLATAQGLAQNAQAYYASGDYAKAKTTADQAYDAAIASKGSDNTLMMGVAVLVVAGAGVVFYMRREGKMGGKDPVKTKAAPTPPLGTVDEGPVNINAIFSKNPDLRVDDKEVVRFLTERGGEAFANEIRDRFEIPRTSAWRMIRRLIGMGVVEERKIGGQSLIYVVKRYRGVSEA